MGYVFFVVFFFFFLPGRVGDRECEIKFSQPVSYYPFLKGTVSFKFLNPQISLDYSVQCKACPWQLQSWGRGKQKNGKGFKRKMKYDLL